MDQRVLQDLLSEKLPRLTAHLGQRHVDLSLITFNWFLVIFADSLISDILLRVWDAFLYEGTKVSMPGPSCPAGPHSIGRRPPVRAVWDTQELSSLNCKVLCAI